MRVRFSPSFAARIVRSNDMRNSIEFLRGKVPFPRAGYILYISYFETGFCLHGWGCGRSIGRL